MTELRQAAQAVVERWDTPAWEWRAPGPTADLMADLRKALAQPEFYQPAASEAVEILKSLGYVYKPTYTGLAWVAKKSAQRPWQGLTDEDMRKFAAAQYGWEALLIAAEAKLKERNNGP